MTRKICDAQKNWTMLKNGKSLAHKHRGFLSSDPLRFAAPVLRHRVRSWHRRADAKEQSTGLFH